MAEYPQVPGYRIEKELGRGGMATVYLAVHEKLNRKVAVKVLSPLLLQDQEFSHRFLREAETAASLTHPSIVTIYDVGESGGNFHIIMEYLEESLKERIQRREVNTEIALQITARIAAALDYAHGQGFIHCDIKPENILFRKDGMPVLVDFGIAKAMDAATKLTKTGMSIGTPYYMSPEQGRGEKLDGRSDFYSLGVVLYEMLTGKVPYDAENTVGIVIKHIQEPIPVLPVELSCYQPLLEKMMAKDLAFRIQCAAELKDLLPANAAPGRSVYEEYEDAHRLATRRIQEEAAVPIKQEAIKKSITTEPIDLRNADLVELHLRKARQKITMIRIIVIIVFFMAALNL